MTLILNSDDNNTGGVCSVLRLYNFGEGHVSGYTRNSSKYTDVGIKDYESFIAQLKVAAERLDKVYPIDQASMVIAFATDLQPDAQGYLRKAGFTEFHIPEYKKYYHGISQFTISIADFHVLVGREYAVEKEGSRVAGHFYSKVFDRVIQNAENDDGEIEDEESLTETLKNANRELRFG